MLHIMVSRVRVLKDVQVAEVAEADSSRGMPVLRTPFSVCLPMLPQSSF